MDPLRPPDEGITSDVLNSVFGPDKIEQLLADSKDLAAARALVVILHRAHLVACYVGGLLTSFAFAWKLSLVWWKFYLFSVICGLLFGGVVWLVSRVISDAVLSNEHFSPKTAAIVTVLIVLLLPILLLPVFTDHATS